MIIFQLITTWMLFQIFAALPLSSSGRQADTSDADGPFLPVPSVI